MVWLHDLAYLSGGAVLANAIPHTVSGVTGRAFQTPFARPPGKGLSSATVNVVWGCANLAVAYGLVFQVGRFDPRAGDQIASFGIGILAMGLMTARIFGPLHGGASPGDA